MKKLFSLFTNVFSFLPSSSASTPAAAPVTGMPIDQEECTLTVCNPPAGTDAFYRWNLNDKGAVADMKLVFQMLKGEKFSFFPVQPSDGNALEVGVPVREPMTEESYLAMPKITGG